MILSLGTAQLGLNYGIANRVGMMSTRQAFKILDAAWANGIRALDTAPAYGKSEERIGKYLRRHKDHDFHVTTKISIVDLQNVDMTSAESRRRLGKIDSMLYHCLGCGGKTIKTLNPQYAEGISLNIRAEVRHTLQGFKIYQFPVNALSGKNEETVKFMSGGGFGMQARSLLLQGLMAIDPEDCPIVGAAPYLKKLNRIASDYKMSIIELCVRWAWNLPLKTAIIGAETVKQVEQIAEYFARGELPARLVERVYKMRKGIPEHVVSPRLWGIEYDFTVKGLEERG